MAPDNRPRIVAGKDNTAEQRHGRDSISRFREVLPQVRNCAREQPSVLLLGMLRSRGKVRQYTYNITISNIVHTNTTPERYKFVYNFFPLRHASVVDSTIMRWRIQECATEEACSIAHFSSVCLYPVPHDGRMNN